MAKPSKKNTISVILPAESVYGYGGVLKENHEIDGYEINVSFPDNDGKVHNSLTHVFPSQVEKIDNEHTKVTLNTDKPVGMSIKGNKYGSHEWSYQEVDAKAFVSGVNAAKDVKVGDYIAGAKGEHDDTTKGVHIEKRPMTDNYTVNAQRDDSLHLSTEDSFGNRLQSALGEMESFKELHQKMSKMIDERSSKDDTDDFDLG